MKKSLLWLVLILFCSCSSPSRVGVLYDTNGNPLAQTAVRLISIDDEGTELAQLGTTVTDAQGQFNFELSKDTTASVAVEATVSNATLRGFWAGRNSEVSLHPLSQALVSVVLEITASSGGRSVQDFSAQELKNISTLLFESEDVPTDLTDEEALEGFVRTSVGREIAQASGGAITSQSASLVEGTETPSAASFSHACTGGGMAEVLSSSNFQFDVRRSGALCGETDGGVSPMLVSNSFDLVLENETFFLNGGSSFSSGAQAQFENNREFVLGPYTLQKPLLAEDDPIEEDTLEISRKVYVPESGDWIRYLEVFENTGVQSRTVSFQVGASLFTSNESHVLTFDPETQTLSESSRFLAVDDQNTNRPTVGFVFQDGLGLSPSVLYAPGLAGGAVNEVASLYSDIVVAAGEKKTFLHYAFLTLSRDASSVQTHLKTMVTDPDMTGLSLSELASLQNFSPSNGTLLGEAGSVIGYAEVTATSGSQTLTVKAKKDGSFALPLNVGTGDVVVLTASDGLNTTLTVD